MSPQRSAALVEAGVYLQLTGDLEGAKVLFRRALKLDPQNAKAQMLLAELEPRAPDPAGNVKTLPPQRVAPIPPVAQARPATGASPAHTSLPPPVPTPVPARPGVPGNGAQTARMDPLATMFGSIPKGLQSSSRTVIGRPLFPAPSITELRRTVEQHLRVRAYDQALLATLEHLKSDPEQLEAHELAWDVLVAAGQKELADSQLANLVELATEREDIERLRRLLPMLEERAPKHVVLDKARALFSGGKVADADSTRIDAAILSVV
jgi:tetratricopeptide (TPR) repeat protein